MPLIDTIPERLIRTPLGLRLAAAQVAVATDVLPDGRFGQEWLVITESTLSVLAEDQPPRLELALEEIHSAEAESMIGSGMLTAQLRGERREILRFSNRQARKIGRVATYLRELAAHRKLRATDPAAVPPTLAEERGGVRRCPRCQLLLPDEHEPCPASIEKGQVVPRLVQRMGRYLWNSIWFSALTLLGLALSLFTPYLSKPLMDSALVAPHLPRPVRMHNLLVISLEMLAAGLAAQLVGMLRSYMVVRLGNRVTHDLRSELFAHLQQLSLRYFDRRQVGQLITRVTQDTQSVESIISDGVQFFLVNILSLIAIIIILGCLNWRLMLLVLVPVPLVAVISGVFWPRIFARWRRYHFLRGRLTSSVNDAMSGMRVVKAFAREHSEAERFRRISGEAMRGEVEAESLWVTVFPWLSYLGAFGGLLVGYIGGREVVGAEIPLGTLTAFTAYLGFFYGPLQFLSRMVDYFARALASAARIFEVLDTVPEVREAKDAPALTRIEGAVEFEDVGFGYDRQKPVVKGLSFQVRPGEMIGLVGQSGAGKSTLINLLCRFYDVDSGCIRIDGRDVRNIPQGDLRSRIGVVLQDTFLFNGTISENIAYARPDAPLLEIIAAAKAAKAHGFIRGKPDGYDSQLGERGVGLSGGERQRIAIARAILHDPRILLLDEATASVDTQTEQQIQEAIQRLVHGRTTFAIAHRLSTLRHADRLVVLKEGKLAEIGTHAELLASGASSAAW